MGMNTKDPVWRRKQTPETLKQVDELLEREALRLVRKDIADAAQRRIWNQVSGKSNAV